MLLFTRLSLADLVEVCRTLRHNLGAGLSLVSVFNQLARRGSSKVRPVAERIAEGLESGESLEDMLKQEQAAFPPLMVALLSVGEHTGSLPDVLEELENYFVLQQKLRKQFIAQIAWPAFQLLMVPFVLAGMVFLLALLGSGFDPLGFGLTGTMGAVKILVYSFGLLGALLGCIYFLTRTLRQKAMVDGLLLRLPGVGGCLEALALSRFCLAMRLTMDTSLPVASSVRLSLKATGNAAFEEHADDVRKAVKKGDDLAAALEEAKVFPDTFLHIVANAEEGGRLPEVMRQQAEVHQENAAFKLTLLTRVLTFGIWILVAVIIIYFITQLVGGILSPYESLFKELNL